MINMTTKLKDNLNGRRPKWKTTKMEEDQNVRLQKLKTSKMDKTQLEAEENGRRPE